MQKAHNLLYPFVTHIYKQIVLDLCQILLYITTVKTECLFPLIIHAIFEANFSIWNKLFTCCIRLCFRFMLYDYPLLWCIILLKSETLFFRKICSFDLQDICINWITIVALMVASGAIVIHVFSHNGCEVNAK